MDLNEQLYIVEGRVLPETIKKVVEAKRLLETRMAKTVRDAAAAAGLSRSAFYRYKDSVYLFYENTRGKTVTFSMDLTDVPGTLGGVLNVLAGGSLNILTINQTIPINNIANVTVTAETGSAREDIGIVFEKIKATEGVLSLTIVARE